MVVACAAGVEAETISLSSRLAWEGARLRQHFRFPGQGQGQALTMHQAMQSRCKRKLRENLDAKDYEGTAASLTITSGHYCGFDTIICRLLAVRSDWYVFASQPILPLFRGSWRDGDGKHMPAIVLLHESEFVVNWVTNGPNPFDGVHIKGHEVLDEVTTRCKCFFQSDHDDDDDTYDYDTDDDTAGRRDDDDDDGYSSSGSSPTTPLPLSIASNGPPSPPGSRTSAIGGDTEDSVNSVLYNIINRQWHRRHQQLHNTDDDEVINNNNNNNDRRSSTTSSDEETEFEFVIHQVNQHIHSSSTRQLLPPSFSSSSHPRVSE